MAGPGFTATKCVEARTRGFGLPARLVRWSAPRVINATVKPAEGYIYGQCAQTGELSCEFDESGHGICVGEGWAPVVLPGGGFSEAWCGA